MLHVSNSIKLSTTNLCPVVIGYNYIPGETMLYTWGLGVAVSGGSLPFTKKEKKKKGGSLHFDLSVTDFHSVKNYYFCAMYY